MYLYFPVSQFVVVPDTVPRVVALIDLEQDDDTDHLFSDPDIRVPKNAWEPIMTEDGTFYLSVMMSATRFYLNHLGYFGQPEMSPNIEFASKFKYTTTTGTQIECYPMNDRYPVITPQPMLSVRIDHNRCPVLQYSSKKDPTISNEICLVDHLPHVHYTIK